MGINIYFHDGKQEKRTENELPTIKTLLVGRVPGVGDKSECTYNKPFKVRGMRDFESQVKPQLDITIEDEDGNEVEEVAPYYKDRNGKSLAEKTNPNELVSIMRTRDSKGEIVETETGILLRVLQKRAGVQRLIDAIQGVQDEDAALPQNIQLADLLRCFEEEHNRIEQSMAALLHILAKLETGQITNADLELALGNLGVNEEKEKGTEE